MKTLYILKHDPNPYNSIYKIGITGKTADERCKEIKATLTNRRLVVFWQGKFLGAYFIEQFLHALLAPINVRMGERVSGYTEFFDLNWFSVRVLVFALELYQFAFFILMLTVFYFFMRYLGIFM